jgi:hypothetical protein
MTLGNDGLSTKSKKILTDSFVGNKSIDENEHAYFKDPTERYVRLKILEIELDRLGIKKLGEKLTKEQFNKILENSINKMTSKDQDDSMFLNKNAFDFLEFLNMEDGKNGGYELLKKMLDEIALNESESKGDTYSHDEWNYA